MSVETHCSVVEWVIVSSCLGECWVGPVAEARFVKYTGYGNAAGLLAQRGLMLGGRGQGEYSSESEDSETEEYAALKDQ